MEATIIEDPKGLESKYHHHHLRQSGGQGGMRCNQSALKLPPKPSETKSQPNDTQRTARHVDGPARFLAKETQSILALRRK